MQLLDKKVFFLNKNILLIVKPLAQRVLPPLLKEKGWGEVKPAIEALTFLFG
jgi:hypothetical protein